MPPLKLFHTGIYIPLVDSSQNIDWNTFIAPFRYDLWCMVIIISIAIAAIKSLILYFTENSILLLDGICFLWTSFIANFSGKPTPTKIDKKRSYKAIVFTSLLSGVLLWISYRSMLSAALTVTYKKFPFDDMESFSRTDWRYICNPGMTTITLQMMAITITISAKIMMVITIIHQMDRSKFDGIHHHHPSLFISIYPIIFGN